MRNYLITFCIVWAAGFFFANQMASAVDAKLDQLQEARVTQLCEIDESLCN